MQTNQTTVTEFILVGFSDHPELQIPLFIFFLLVYIITVVGNIGIIILTITDAKLQTPMYFFLRNLSIVDIGYSTTIAPKLLTTFVIENSTISFAGCVTQFSFFAVFVTAETCILAVMAYDRFIAICYPLQYSVVMSKKLCILLVIVAYTCGFVNSTAHSKVMFTLNFCNSNIINHYFCDVPPLLSLSCSDTQLAQLVHFILSTFFGGATFLIVLISYIAIVIAILKISSAQGRKKAFNTCASHLTTVIIFFGTLISMYSRPSSISLDKDKIISIFYTLIISSLNPFIYSLRNKDVKDATSRFLHKITLLK
ncbi:olfactory receptor 5AR1-like [Erythrolamprus reginae]|uniref:olfactory receptor 5AR1-like n=1 Tax=Erythrolamprus reginae TaxID=121349 RepID=UPI00396C7D84